MPNATSKSALSLVTRLGSALISRTTSQQHLNISELGPKSQWRVRSSGTCHVLQCVAAPEATSALRLERVDQSLAVQGADRRRLHAQHGKREREDDAQMAVTPVVSMMRGAWSLGAGCAPPTHVVWHHAVA